MRAILRLHMLGFVEIRNFPGNLNLIAIGIETRNTPHAADAFSCGLPELLAPDAIGTNSSDSGDYNAAFHFSSSQGSSLRLCLLLTRQYRLEVMDPANASSTRTTPRHALAGLQAGVLGAVAMFAWLTIASVWNHRSVWTVPNLFSTTFFGSGAYRNEFLRTSASGIALMLTIYGLAGLVWGLLWGFLYGEERKPFIVLSGVVTGLLVYFLFFDFVWKHANPVIILYAPDRQLEVGHMLWGFVLARFPKYSRRIAEANFESTADAASEVSGGELPAADLRQETAEVKSGDEME